jgi:hypothetical protein
MNPTPFGLRCWRTEPRRRSWPWWLGMLVLVVLNQPSWAQEGHKGEAPPARGAQPPVNRLAQETSPYLRQHAHNPVDWYPWGPEALERARRENMTCPPKTSPDVKLE